MELQLFPISFVWDLRSFNNSFIRIIKSSTGVEKRCVCIPIEDNFLEEGGYTHKVTGELVRYCRATIKAWPVTDESRAQFNKTNDYDLRLDISKKVMEMLEKTQPDVAARLAYNSPSRDSELVKRVLPYVGRGYLIRPQEVAQEQVSSVVMTPSEGEEDLPF